MEITLQYFEGCPNWVLAGDRVREAVRSAGRGQVVITYETIDTPEEARRARFRGSPTILVDGRD